MVDPKRLQIFVAAGEANIRAVKVERPGAAGLRAEDALIEDKEIFVVTAGAGRLEGAGHTNDQVAIGIKVQRVNVLAAVAEADIGAIEVERPGACGIRSKAGGGEEQDIGFIDFAEVVQGEILIHTDQEAAIGQEAKGIDIDVAQAHIRAIKDQTPAIGRGIVGNDILVPVR